jgi:hypothetical protein
LVPGTSRLLKFVVAHYRSGRGAGYHRSRFGGEWRGAWTTGSSGQYVGLH